MEQTTNQTVYRSGSRNIAGYILLSIAIVLGCFILAKAFADNYYSSGGNSNIGFPDSIEAQVNSADSDYLDENQAMWYVGLQHYYAVWENLIDSGELDGAYVTFDAQKGVDVSAVVRVFSKAKLDEWMGARFASQESGVRD